MFIGEIIKDFEFIESYKCDYIYATYFFEMQKQLILIALLLCFQSGFGQALPRVKIETSMGDIVIEADTIRAPLTANNFLNLVNGGILNNATFYRVVRMDNQPNNEVKIEVIQGGLFRDEEIIKHKPVQHETTQTTGLRHLNGTISMARVEPGTASTEFFICVGPQPELDFGGKRNPDGQGFAAFGTVVSGMEVVKKIQQQKDQQQYLTEPVKIFRTEIITQ